MSIVITGSEGFIGSALRRLCRERNIDYLGIDFSTFPGSESLCKDIRSPEIEYVIPENTTTLIHLAAVSTDADCRRDPGRAYDINVTGLQNLIGAAKKKKVKQFIFASSEWVYGDTDPQAIHVEEQAIDLTKILSTYTLSKACGEQILRMAYQEGAFSVVIFRFSIVYGPRLSRWSAVEALLHQVGTHENVTIGSRKTARRFIHVQDICQGLLAAAGRTGFDIFNLSGDEIITLGDIIDRSADLVKRSPNIIEQSPGQISIRNPQNRKIKEQLGWLPGYDLQKGMLSLLDSKEMAYLKPSLAKR